MTASKYALIEKVLQYVSIDIDNPDTCPFRVTTTDILPAQRTLTDHDVVDLTLALTATDLGHRDVATLFGIPEEDVIDFSVGDESALSVWVEAIGLEAYEEEDAEEVVENLAKYGTEARENGVPLPLYRAAQGRDPQLDMVRNEIVSAWLRRAHERNS